MGKRKNSVDDKIRRAWRDLKASEGADLEAARRLVAALERAGAESGKSKRAVEEEDAREAVNVLRNEYFKSVQATARELEEAVKSGEIEDREQLMDRIHEEVDGSAWVIYTGNAQQVLFVSENSDAAWDEGLTEGEAQWSQWAYAAMERDLIESLDIDVNDDSSWEREPSDDELDEAEEEEEADEPAENEPSGYGANPNCCDACGHGHSADDCDVKGCGCEEIFG